MVDGEAGCGKSTLLAVIAGFQPAPTGQILTFGRASSRLPQKLRREALGYAGAAAPLLQGTLAENLNYRLRGPVDADHMAWLMEATGLSHRVESDGSITRLSIRDGGQRLPGSEVQAIQIIRAMAGSPRLLVLDDVFDALGEAEARRLVAALKAWPGVAVLASRRPAIRAAANRIWQIAGGVITEKPVANQSSAAILPLSPRLKG